MDTVYDDICFGCNACTQVCRRKAISMIEDIEGFKYPQIDMSICVDCGLCRKICPANSSERYKQNNLRLLAVQSKDKISLLKSSSGGVFSLIAEEILSNNGVVFGAAFKEDMTCNHLVIESKDGLDVLRGSKYVHSDTNTTYIQVKNYLKEGRLVYYTGTPCQIAGLKAFLNKSYDNLITSDLVCHGTPSQKVFSLFISKISSAYKQRVIEYYFRDKRISGWACSSSCVTIDKKGKRHYHIAHKYMSAYYNAFILGHLFREDCYKCPFADIHRVSDITIADYWGVNKYHHFEEERMGVSMVLLNSKKAIEIWNIIKAKTQFVESKMNFAVNTDNTNLYQHSERPVERDLSYSMVFSDFEKFCSCYKKYFSIYQIYKRYYVNQFAQSTYGRYIYKLLKSCIKKRIQIV